MEQRVNSLFQKVQCSAFRAEPEHNHDKFVCCMNIKCIVKTKALIRGCDQTWLSVCPQFSPTSVFPVPGVGAWAGHTPDIWSLGWTWSLVIDGWVGEVDCVNTDQRRPASLLKTQLVLTAFRDSNWQGWMDFKMFFFFYESVKLKVQSIIVMLASFSSVYL